jgi:hypothetical protein
MNPLFWWLFRIKVLSPYGFILEPFSIWTIPYILIPGITTPPLSGHYLFFVLSLATYLVSEIYVLYVIVVNTCCQQYVDLCN